MNTTKLLYLEDFNLLTSPATVVDVTSEEGRDVVILDQTILYPQGGGQPYDQGTIESPTGKFLVEEVRFIEGVVKHIGTFEKGKLNGRLHSAGHVVDIAIHKLGLEWVPVKGYHFPQGPYVEYKGTLNETEREKIKGDIERVANEFVKEGKATVLRFMPKEEMKSVCYFVPDYLPADKPARVVMYGEFGIPCGGTHVANVSDIKGITIPKVKLEGENIRVRYEITNG